MRALCDNLDLQQVVREPTRQQFLLGLHLTDASGTEIQVGPYIADHRFLLASFPLPEATAIHIKRERFNLNRADWSALKMRLQT